MCRGGFRMKRIVSLLICISLLFANAASAIVLDFSVESSVFVADTFEDAEKSADLSAVSGTDTIYDSVSADDTYTLSYNNGILTAATEEASSNKNFIVVPLSLEENRTYRISFGIRVVSHGGTSRTKAKIRPSWIFTGTGRITGNSADTTGSNHDAKAVDLSISEIFTDFSSEIAVKEITERGSMSFRVSTNPIQRGQTVVTAPTYEIKDLAFYERYDIFYESGNHCELGENSEEIPVTSGVYLDGSSTTTVNISSSAMPYVSKDDRWYIDESKPWIDQDGNEYAIGEEIDFSSVKKSIVLTPNIKTNQATYTVTFDNSGLSSCPEAISAFENDSINLMAYSSALASAEGMRFAGWTDEKNGTEIVNVINVTEDITLYPVINKNYDFANDDAYNGTTVNGATLVQKQGGNTIGVANIAEGANAYVSLGNPKLPTSLYKAIKIIFDAHSSEEITETFTSDFVSEFEGVYINTGNYYNADGQVKLLSGTELCKAEIVQEDGKNYLELTIDANRSEFWNGTLNYIRIDAYNGGPDYAIRRVEFVPYEAFDEKLVSLVGFKTPECGEKAISLADITDETKIAEVKSIEWTPALLPGNVFDSNTSYTAKVVISPVEGADKVFADDIAVKVDGNDVVLKKNEDGTIEFELSYPATLNVEKYSVTFDTSGLKTDSVPTQVFAFEGKTFYVSAYNTAVSSDSKLRFNGWATTPGETDVFKAVDSLDITENITLYPIISYDINMSCAENQKNWTFTNASAEFTEDGYMVVTQEGPTLDAMATVKNLSINTAQFIGIKIYYSPDNFNENIDVIYFNRAGESASSARYLVGVKKGIDTETGYNLVSYSALGAQNWNGILSSIRFDFFRGAGSSAVKAIVFEYPDTIDTDNITITGIQTPETGKEDKSPEHIKEISEFGSAFEKIEWTPALKNGRFEADTEYTAKVYFAPKTATRFDPDRQLTITFGEKISNAQIDESGRICASFNFEKTESYKQFSMSINGEESFYVDGKQRQYQVEFDGEVPDKAVKWTLENTEYLSIDENGILTVVKNGAVATKLKAISLYNPNVYAEIDLETLLYQFTFEIVGPEIIAKENRSTEYNLKITSGSCYDTSATWSVDNSKIATIDEKTGKLVPLKNGTVVITAVSNYNPSMSATFTVELLNQAESHLLSFNPGTSEEVGNMPVPSEESGIVDLFEFPSPTRNGYLFLGWAEDDESFNPISTVNMTEDKTLYAVWGKGIMYSYGNKGNSNVSGVAVYDNYIEATCPDLGYWRLPFKGLSIDPTVIGTVIVRASYDGGTRDRVYYKSVYVDDKGKDVTIGYDTNSYQFAEKQAHSVYSTKTGLENFESLIHHIGRDQYSDSPGLWSKAKKITELHIDVAKVAGLTFRLQYIALLDSRRMVKFDANTTDSVIGMPDSMEALQGDTVTITEIPLRNGYKFIGWSKTSDNTDNPKNKFGIVDDITLYAVWNKVINGENIVSGNVTTFDIGDLIPDTDGNALLIKLTDDNVYDVTFTYTDESGEHQTVAPSAANGYAVIDLTGLETINDVQLSVSSKTEFEEITVTSLGYALYKQNYVEQGNNNSSNGSNNPFYTEDNMKVENVVNNSQRYDPSATESEVSEENLEETVRFGFVVDGRIVFEDVKTSHWYRSEVITAYKMGLIKGRSEDIFDPYGNVTVAEAITLAVRLNYAYNGMTDDVELSDGAEWYKNYVDKAIELEIIEEGLFSDYNAFALRREVAVIMSKSVPKSYLNLINKFVDIPDVPRTDPDFEVIRRLYNVGIVQGSDSEYNFFPDTNITRAEMAAIINRIAIPENRKRNITERERLAKIQTYTASQIVAGASLVNCEDVKMVLKDGSAYAVASTRDPILFLDGFIDLFNGTAVTQIRVYMKWNPEVVENPTEKGCKIFFTTVDNSKWDAGRCIDGEWNGSFDEHGFAEIIFDCTSSKDFNGMIDKLRFDPFDIKTDFVIEKIVIE